MGLPSCIKSMDCDVYGVWADIKDSEKLEYWDIHVSSLIFVEMVKFTEYHINRNFSKSKNLAF